MDDDHLDRARTKKRGIQDVQKYEEGQKKRFKPDKERTESPLGMLPVELLYSIHLYAKNPAFTMLNRHFYDTFTHCPTSIKAAYLIARWHEAYCYGFDTTPKSGGKSAAKAKTASAASRLQGDNAGPALPTLSSDLLRGGEMPELSWSSRLLPVIPVTEFPYPLSFSSERSVDHFILDACLRYPLCNQEVLRAVEDMILSSPEFGNIVLATGLWRVEGDSELCTYETFYSKDRDEDLACVKPCHLMVNELPKRLFRGFDKAALEAASKEGRNGRFDPEVIRHLEAIGPLPPSPSLPLLLEIISLHLAYSLDSYPQTSNPVNSFEGMPLAKATFQRNSFMAQFLLCLGADPSQKKSLSLYLAIRSGWLQGLQMMVERDALQLQAGKRAISEIRKWYTRNDDKRRNRRQLIEDDAALIDPNESSEIELPETNSRKRRRLADRIHLNTTMLKEAVKHDQWAVADWIRSKNVAADIRTLQLLEMKKPGKSSS